MNYRFLEHVTDAYIEAEGSTLEEAFENAARALVDTMIDIHNIECIRKVSIDTSGSDLEELLYNWLEEILLKLVVDRLALKDFKVKIVKNANYKLHGEAYGEKLDLKKHNYKVEIKGVTYHLMEIKKDSKYKVRFILDL